MTTTPRKQRKTLPAATGTCHWVCQLTAQHAGCLTINGKVYLVAENRDGARLVGYTLRKPDSTVYDIDITEPWGWTCSCPDATLRVERQCQCKHTRGLRAALAAIDGKACASLPTGAL